jgi:hypothetical protein
MMQLQHAFDQISLTYACTLSREIAPFPTKQESKRALNGLLLVDCEQSQANGTPKATQPFVQGETTFPRGKKSYRSPMPITSVSLQPAVDLDISFFRKRHR